MQSTMETSIARATVVARRKLKQALDGRYDDLRREQIRPKATLNVDESRERLALLVTRLIRGEAGLNAQALAILEEQAALPADLMQFSGKAQVLRRVNDPAIYILVKAGCVVYIGQSTRVLNRLGNHQGNKDFDSVYLLPCDEQDLNKLERRLIAAFPHCFNGNNGIKRDGVTVDRQTTYRPNWGPKDVVVR